MRKLRQVFQIFFLVFYKQEVAKPKQSWYVALIYYVKWLTITMSITLEFAISVEWIFLFINEKEKKCVGVGFVPTESKTLCFI